VRRVGGLEYAHDHDRLVVPFPLISDKRRQGINLGPKEFAEMGLRVGTARRFPSEDGPVVGDAEEQPTADCVRKRRDGRTEAGICRRLLLALDEEILAVLDQSAEGLVVEVSEW
jgi:hypothetical protein